MHSLGLGQWEAPARKLVWGFFVYSKHYYMTIHEAKKLPNGVYEIHWKTGGKSVAAVGRLHDGKPWLAPANWTAKDGITFRANYWRKVERAMLIMESHS